MAKIHIGRWVAIACTVVLLMFGALLLGMIWATLWLWPLPGIL
jgi:hypothetical protein